MQAQATGNCTVTVQVRGHEIVGFETGGDDWRYGHIVSHAVFDAVEKATDALKARPAKKIKVETTQVKANEAKAAKVKTEPTPVVKSEPEPEKKPPRKVTKARDRPVKTEEDLVNLVSEDEEGGGTGGLRYL